MADLHNGHTKLVIPSETGTVPVNIRLVSDGLGIEWVAPGSSAEKAGLKRGQRVLAVNGVPVDEAARRVSGWHMAYASPRTRLRNSFRSLLLGPPGTTVDLLVETVQGDHKLATLERAPQRRFWHDWYMSSAEARIEGEIDRQGIAYLKVDGFSGIEIIDRFDAALEQISSAPGLILDLRANNGGMLFVALVVTGRFLQEDLLLGEMCRNPENQEETMSCEEQWAGPGELVYEGQLAVLIDEDTFSAGEWVAYALCEAGPARCFGRPTAGETDSVFTWEVPGAIIRISNSSFRPAVGAPIQGHGVEPDELIPLTLEDLRLGTDRSRDTAQRWLLRQIQSKPDDVASGHGEESAMAITG